MRKRQRIKLLKLFKVDSAKTRRKKIVGIPKMHGDEISLKFGYWGLGMGGGAIAYECAAKPISSKKPESLPYTGLITNTNPVDYKKLPDLPNIKKVQLKGFIGGAGRNIKDGEKAFLDNIEEVSKAFDEQFTDRDFIWIICGLGGGSGTGSILEAIKMAIKKGFNKKFGLIITVPENDEGQKVLDNAMKRLSSLISTVFSKKLCSVVLVDNQKLFQDYMQKNPKATVTECLDFSNRFVADTLHEINVVTCSFSPSGNFHFDGSELLNALRQPGFITFNRMVKSDKEIDPETESTFLPEIKSSIENGLLSNGYDLSTAKHIAISMVAKEETAKNVFLRLDFNNKVKGLINDMAPSVPQRPLAGYGSTDPDFPSYIYTYTIFSGLSSPARIAELVDVASQLNNSVQIQQEDKVLSKLQTYIGVEDEENSDLDVDNLFGDAPSSSTSEVAAASESHEEDVDPDKLFD